jgi:hypothetical protein
VTVREIVLAALAGDEEAARAGLLALVTPVQEPDTLLDLKSAANYVGLSEDALDRRARAGMVPSRQEGPRCKRFFLKSELDDYMRGRTPKEVAA